MMGRFLIFLTTVGALVFLAGCSSIRAPERPRAPRSPESVRTIGQESGALEWAVDPLGDPEWPIVGRVAWFFGPGH